MLKVVVKNFRYQIEETVLLKEVAVDFNSGDFYVITGSNGSGKTSLLNIITGIIPNVIVGNYTGKVSFKNKKVLPSQIDFVFQYSENSLFFNSVKEQLKGINKTIILDIFKKNNINIKYSDYIKDLSTGERKIVSCLSALFSKRPICILDEPTSNLDDKNIAILIDIIKKQMSKKIIIIVSHNEKIISSGGIVYNIKRGKLNLVNYKSLPKKQFKNTLVNTNENILVVDGFEYKYENNKKYICKTKINIPNQSITAIIGENGCGKSTFAKYIYDNCSKFTNKKLTLKKITCSVMFAFSHKHFLKNSVIEEMALISKINKKILTDILCKENLSFLIDKDPRFISEGQQKFVFATSLLLKNDNLLILDEPFDNLDVNLTSALKKQMLEFIKRGNTLVILDQNDDVFSEITDKKIVLKGGLTE